MLASKGEISGPGFIDHLSPDAFGSKNKFNRLANCTVPGEGFRRIVRDCFYFWHGIANGDGQAGTAHQWNIGEIVSDKRHFMV